MTAATSHILLVDDDALLRRGLSFHLQQAGYRVSNAACAEDALALAQRDAPDLVLLDIGLPGMDGLEALRRFQEDVPVPVIFLTARRRHLDEVLGLELGADDYISKPFDTDVLLARVKAAIRRQPQASGGDERAEQTLTVGDIVLDPGAHKVTVAGRAVEMAPREFDLLHALMLQPGQVVRREELLAQVWGAEYVGEPQVIYVHIRWLREKIEEEPQQPRRITTVHGVGYRLEPQGS